MVVDVIDKVAPFAGFMALSHPMIVICSSY
jgi:hypothetical protein